MRRAVIPFAVSLLLLVSTMPAVAQGRPVTPDWAIYTFGPSGQTLTSRRADAPTSGTAQFTFLSTPDDALLATARPEGPHASLAGRTITAVFSIDASAGATFTYFGEGTPSNTCGTPASVRLYFSTNGAFGFGTDNDWFSKFWWSNAAGSSAILADGTFTVTAIVEPGSWSNWNGKQGTDRPDGFAAAAANPDLIGLSFGGGCFYENGVGVDSGSATFTLVSLEIN